MRLFLLALLATILSVPAHAENGTAIEGTPVPASGAVSMPPETPVTKAQLELAGQMHDIWPIRTRIESAYDSVAKQFPEERQPEVKALLRKSTDFDELEEASIKAMAQTFTEEELKTMIAFYGSDVGRSISAKTDDYEAAIRPTIDKMISKAMMDLRVGAGP